MHLREQRLAVEAAEHVGAKEITEASATACRLVSREELAVRGELLVGGPDLARELVAYPRREELLVLFPFAVGVALRRLTGGCPCDRCRLRRLRDLRGQLVRVDRSGATALLRSAPLAARRIVEEAGLLQVSPGPRDSTTYFASIGLLGVMRNCRDVGSQLHFRNDVAIELLDRERSSLSTQHVQNRVHVLLVDGHARCATLCHLTLLSAWPAPNAANPGKSGNRTECE